MNTAHKFSVSGAQNRTYFRANFCGPYRISLDELFEFVGYEKYNQIRQDPCLCFLSRCGPPDNKALLAEQNDDDDMK